MASQSAIDFDVAILFSSKEVACGKGILKVMEQVILVNERDEMTGLEEKIKAHLLGVLHRAFSKYF